MLPYSYSYLSELDITLTSWLSRNNRRCQTLTEVLHPLPVFPLYISNNSLCLSPIYCFISLNNHLFNHSCCLMIRIISLALEMVDSWWGPSLLLSSPFLGFFLLFSSLFCFFKILSTSISSMLISSLFVTFVTMFLVVALRPGKLKWKYTLMCHLGRHTV